MGIIILLLQTLIYVLSYVDKAFYFVPVLVVQILSCFRKSIPLLMVIPIVAPIITYFLFPKWVALMVLGVALTLYWGKPRNMMELVDAPAINREYGFLCDIAGNLLYFGCIIYGFIK